MARKDKLYTVNKFNRPAFMPKEENLFLNGGNANALAQADYQKNPWNYTQDYMYGNGPSITDQYLNSKNAFGISKAQNLFSKANLGIAPGGSTLKGVGSAMGSALIGGVAGMGAQIIGDTIGGIAGAIGNGVGNLLGGGKKSGVGNAVQSVTGGLGDIVGGVPIVGGLAKGALNLVGGIVGGGVNALVGTKVNQEALNAANKGTSTLNSFTSNASSLDAISGPTAQANVQNAYSGGAFKKGWARRKNAELKQARADARMFADRSISNNVKNLVSDQMNDALANYSAFGGPIDFNDRNMGAIEYGFMSDYLDNGREKAESKNNMTNLFAGVPSSLFADGGGIHIKPSHRGRLTELKERTGKTEAELYNDGNPAHKKMVVFARNSRKWHADGGPLFAFGGDMTTNSRSYSVGNIYDVTEAEANRLKSLGYEFRIVG